jgi:hypothetical protein
MCADETSANGKDPSEDADRKLWFDLLSKINDRNLQTARASGATTWVLLGVAAAIIYRGVPALPSILSSRALLTETSVIFVLVFDFLMMLCLALAFVALYVEGQREMRMQTELSKRAKNVLLLFGVVVLFVISVMHIWLAAKITTGVAMRSVLIAFGFLWALNILLPIAKTLRAVWAAKRLNAVLPAFDGVSVPTIARPFVGCAFLLLSIVPCWVLLRYLRLLSQSPTGMILPLGAASHFLTLLVVCFILFGRAFIAAPHRDAFLALERAILVEELRPSDIKARFVTQLLGPSAADWLQKIADRAKAADVRLSAAVTRIQPRIAEVEAISIEYPLERIGRLNLLVDELKAASDEHTAELDACIFQLEEYARFPMSSNELNILKNILAERRAAIEHSKKHPSSFQQTLEQMRALANPPENRGLPQSEG